MKDIIIFLIKLNLKIYLYLVYFLIVSFILEKLGGLYFFIKNFMEKKSSSSAEGSSDIWFIFSWIFGLIIAGSNIFYFKNGPQGISKLSLTLLFMISYFPFTFLSYKFYFHFQKRTRQTKFKVKFNKVYRKAKRKIKRTLN